MRQDPTRRMHVTTVEGKGHRGRPRFGWEDGVTNIKLLEERNRRNAARK